ncbi:MAG: YqgE/AlgH family protein [Paracoccaceae bacterium]
MKKTSDSIDLNGKLLIAMPGMSDPRFANSVIFMCAHSDDGAMGLIVNKPTDELQLTDLLEQLAIPQIKSGQEIRVHFGGPVELGRGFVLHSADYVSSDVTLEVDAQFGMTATREILEAIADGTGPDSALLMLGYAGWEPGQLENEIKDNGWLVADATPEIVFGTGNSDKWKAALGTLGIDPLMLSSVAGRA